ncbi:hypothetical protein RchiOBHm_Chr1g0356931 [Rosa chinensis]|uniref:Uncharacterized protein n=1 Tax=Rosa chinensis TaxID=74649 RepID=A0A2P6SHS1_ROSCH|nr:hypothetical protein RchiOBHm_Chr1g0356931 [Rosa chinensis]
MWLSVLQEKLMVDIGRICALPLGDQQSSLRNAYGPALLCAIYFAVIPNLEGPAVSHQYCALRLIQAIPDKCLYQLAGKLVCHWKFHVLI